MFAPKDVTGRMRAVVRDVLAPGRRAVRAGWDWCSTWPQALRQRLGPAASETEGAQPALAGNDRELARLQLELAESRQLLADERQRASAGLPQSEIPHLYEADLVNVRVLGEEVAGLWRARPMLDGGLAGGIREAALVLDDPRPVLDAGTDASLAADQPVFAGGAVVGKILRAGRYSSTLCPLTDPEFSGAARLVRRSGQHVEFGAHGTLKGEGTELCRLVRIPSAEPVAAGDLVVSVDTDGLLPPQVYGTVVRADPPEGTLDWQIWVRPAAKPSVRVQVLRLRLNAERVSLNTQ